MACLFKRYKAKLVTKNGIMKYKENKWLGQQFPNNSIILKMMMEAAMTRDWPTSRPLIPA